MLNIQVSENKYVFNTTLGTQLLYIALTSGVLNEQSTFLDSRNALIVAASQIFNKDPLKLRIINRIQEAFDDVGINDSHFNNLPVNYYNPQPRRFASNIS